MLKFILAFLLSTTSFAMNAPAVQQGDCSFEITITGYDNDDPDHPIKVSETTSTYVLDKCEQVKAEK